MKKLVLITLTVIILFGCTTKTLEVGAIQMAIAETQRVVLPTYPSIYTLEPLNYTLEPLKTPRPTAKPWPTNTKIATYTERPTPTVTTMKSGGTQTAEFVGVIQTAIAQTQKIEQSLKLMIAVGLALRQDINPANYEVNLNGTILEIMVQARYFSQDQAELSYSIINDIAWIAPTREDLERMTGLSDISVSLATFSAGGDSMYYSLTDFETLMLVSNEKFSYEEWIKASNAGFK